MKVRITWYTPQVDSIDLEDYGHDETATWDDLNEEEQNEILDFIRDEFILQVKEIKTIE